MGWWHKREKDFPSDCDEVRKSFINSDTVYDQIFVVDSWAKGNSSLELLGKGLFLGAHEVFH